MKRCDRCGESTAGTFVELFAKRICRECYQVWNGLRDSHLAMLFDKFLVEMKAKS